MQRKQARYITNNIALGLGHRIQSVIRPLMPSPGDKIALLDFPNHPNVGDSAIWLGEYMFLQQNGYRENLYLGEINTYSKDDLSGFIGNGTILLHGGGNIGDLWPKHQLFREQVISDFPDNRIIQLPQSVCFREDASLQRARAVFERHPDLTVLTRDGESLDIVTGKLNTRAILCPDMAFYLGPASDEPAAIIKCVWLTRGDLEVRSDIKRPGHRDGVWIYDWMTDDFTTALRSSVMLRYQYSVETDPAKQNTLRKSMSDLFPQLAQERVLRGYQGLARGHGVVTERLHGHILCMLMDIPHCILDTPYGKIRNFVEAWGYESPLVQWSASPDDALETILSL